jgi:S-formylglutathione hydrolase FrmB
MILTTVNFRSEILTQRCSMNVILPQRSLADAQTRPAVKYPTLYLLHGHSDDHTGWQRWTSIERHIEKYNLAVVMPAVHNSFYTDMAHGDRYFTFVSEEVPAVARDMFPLSARREDNFVAGISMGGYGAFKLALSCPKRYAAAASLSGAVDICEVVKEHDDPENEAWLAAMRDVFGDLDKVHGSKHDLFALAEKVARSKTRPRLFQYCGASDFLHADNLRFRDFIRNLRNLPFDLTYEEDSGDHTWGYWDAVIQKVLAWLPLKKE